MRSKQGLGGGGGAVKKQKHSRTTGIGQRIFRLKHEKKDNSTTGLRLQLVSGPVASEAVQVVHDHGLILVI